jgi:hypothetical protein
MRSLADIDAYAVEIRVPLPNRKWGKGSGYVIGPCRILTALHVLVGQDAVLKGEAVVAPAGIEVRAYGDFSERFGRPDVATARYLESVRALARDDDYLWRPAELIWPRNGAAMPRFELAVLEVTPQAALKHILTAPRISCFRPVEDVSCRAMGFPEWTAQNSNGVDISSPMPVIGVQSFGPPTVRTFHPFSVTNVRPPEGNDWQRISGSAFFTEESLALVGVASALLPAATNEGLWLTQLADLAEGDEFQEFWTAAGLARPNRLQVSIGPGIPLPQFPIDPLPYLHEFDRSRPRERVLDIFDPLPPDEQNASSAELVKAISKDEPCPPPIFLIAGRWIDLPDEMVKRIRKKIAPAFIGNRDGEATVLEWPYAADGRVANRIVALLKEQIALSLEAEQPRHVASLASLCEKAKGRDWYLYISVEKANAEDAKALSQLLSEFAKFEPTQRPPVLYVNIVPGYSTISAQEDPRIASFIQLVKQGSTAFADRLLIIDDLYLHDCEFVDIQIWTQDLAHHCRVTAQQCRTYLERIFAAGPYPLQDVRDSLSSATSAR